MPNAEKGVGVLPGAADVSAINAERVSSAEMMHSHVAREDQWVRRRFQDPSLEGRRLFAEVLGTFLLVLAGAGAGVVAALSHGAISRAAAVSAPGLTVLAVILFMGAVSGAHLNPVVSVAFAARGDFPWGRVPGYVIAQLMGATLAVLFLYLVFGRVGDLGSTAPASASTMGKPCS